MIKKNENWTKGIEGEEKAVQYLKSKGFVIIARNYRAGRYAEVDIIAEKEEYICFIEVKTRSGTLYGYGREAVGKKKRLKIRKAASMFLADNNISEKYIRFDVIEIILKGSASDIDYEVNYIDNAF